MEPCARGLGGARAPSVRSLESCAEFPARCASVGELVCPAPGLGARVGESVPGPRAKPEVIFTRWHLQNAQLICHPEPGSFFPPVFFSFSFLSSNPLPRPGEAQAAPVRGRTEGRCRGKGAKVLLGWWEWVAWLLRGGGRYQHGVE